VAWACFALHGMESRERRAWTPYRVRKHTDAPFPGALKRLHPHSLRSRRVRVEPAGRSCVADCRGTRKKYQNVGPWASPCSGIIKIRIRHDAARSRLTAVGFRNRVSLLPTSFHCCEFPGRVYPLLCFMIALATWSARTQAFNSMSRQRFAGSRCADFNRAQRARLNRNGLRGASG